MRRHTPQPGTHRTATQAGSCRHTHSQSSQKCLRMYGSTGHRHTRSTSHTGTCSPAPAATFGFPRRLCSRDREEKLIVSDGPTRIVHLNLPQHLKVPYSQACHKHDLSPPLPQAATAHTPIPQPPCHLSPTIQSPQRRHCASCQTWCSHWALGPSDVPKAAGKALWCSRVSGPLV